MRGKQLGTIPALFITAAPLIRIVLRYAGGYLAARGVLANEHIGYFSDPNVVSAISFGGAAICAIISEGWYWYAHRDPPC